MEQRRPVSEPVWAPTAGYIANANITKFMDAAAVGGLDDLWDWARRDIAGFYDALLPHIGLEWSAPYERTLDLSRGKPFATWFRGGAYNACVNCVDKHVRAGRGGELALSWEDEEGRSRRHTFDELLRDVCRAAGALRRLGIGEGDRVGIYMPLVPEAAIALLAIVRIGAVAVPAFSGYGAQALSARLGDAGAKALITVDGTRRRGRNVDMKQIADAALAELPGIEKVVVYRRTGASIAWKEGRDVDWSAALGDEAPFLEAQRTDANAPCMILYTSGSTGKPKGAVHVHAGFPVKVQIDQYLCFDVKPGDRMLWYTDMGWMMGPFLIFGALGLGAAAILYDGIPDYPRPDRLWESIAAQRATHLGIAPTAIRSLMVHGDAQPARHDLSALRILGSSGETWNPEPYKWFGKAVGGGRAPIINYSGGTEISGGILGCFPIRPLAACAFHGPVPGMDADVVDERGLPVRGQVGELVIRQPWPGMTNSFWRDDKRYLEAYWARLKDTWVHGDWCSIDDAGYWYIHGRSDDTINIAGKRVGPAEYESALVAHKAIKEAAAVAVPDAIKGESVVCLVVARSGSDVGEPLRSELNRLVAASLGKALAPHAIKFVSDLPRTRNGKMMRRIARARYLKLENLGDLSALENPDSLEAIDAAT
ncbi:MAG: AMP-binding protein [Candidatus Eremiobacteraeota bacterium]|nr:AMP-binding protein [Candidatus Eremiobacteraeota bacterium]MBC5828511.1 AMP-binding protein [Candidatus Eremiobacteraeota bacterium]